MSLQVGVPNKKNRFKKGGKTSWRSCQTWNQLETLNWLFVSHFFGDYVFSKSGIFETRSTYLGGLNSFCFPEKRCCVFNQFARPRNSMILLVAKNIWGRKKHATTTNPRDFQFEKTSLKLPVCTWKWMVWIRSFPFLAWPTFRGYVTFWGVDHEIMLYTVCFGRVNNRSVFLFSKWSSSRIEVPGPTGRTCITYIYLSSLMFALTFVFVV